MTSYSSQKKDKDPMYQSFVISLPTASLPSLLTFQVTTLFHNFGHALHGILSETTYRALWN